MSGSFIIPSLHDLLAQRVPQVRMTRALIAVNILVFLAMLFSGAGFWHSSNGVQLAWGANFGPATQDGEWWRLGSALFLHFGVVHLAMNMWALWDAGQFVERMYGLPRFTLIYVLSGVAGNLLSLVSHHGQAVSGGASGAIFGIYGALLACLLRERRHLHPQEFRWLFWGAMGFSAVTIVFGLLIPGIDNAAHIGGLLSGLLIGTVLVRPLLPGDVLRGPVRLVAGAVFLLALSLLIGRIPEPVYRWSDEEQVRMEINLFLRNDMALSHAWQNLMIESVRRGTSFEQLAGRIDTVIGDPYEENFELLSQLPQDPDLPSAHTLETLREYAGMRRDASRSLADGLRFKDPEKIRGALQLEKKSREMHRPKGVASDKTKQGQEQR